MIKPLSVDLDGLKVQLKRESKRPDFFAQQQVLGGEIAEPINGNTLIGRKVMKFFRFTAQKLFLHLSRKHTRFPEH